MRFLLSAKPTGSLQASIDERSEELTELVGIVGESAEQKNNRNGIMGQITQKYVKKENKDVK